jgi:hypothetical protein
MDSGNFMLRKRNLSPKAIYSTIPFTRNVQNRQIQKSSVARAGGGGAGA